MRTPRPIRFVLTILALSSLACAAPPGASKQPVRDAALEARGNVSRNAESTLSALAAEGATFRTGSPIRVAAIPTGEVREWRVDVDAGTQLVVVGGCDVDCRDLNLALVAPDGAIQAGDHSFGALPRLVATAARGGNHRVRVRVGDCADDPCYAGFQLLLLPGDAPRLGEYVIEVRTRIEALASELEAPFREHGTLLLPLTDVEVTSHHTGEISRVEFELPPDSGAVVVAACDADCSDLDLSVDGPDLHLLAADQKSESLPYLVFQTVKGGLYEVTAELRSCRNDPCYAGLQVLRLAPDPSAQQTGTCFAVGPDGLLLTALHVLDAGGPVEVVFPDGSRSAARLEAAVAGLDLALLSVARATPHTLSLAPPRSVRAGDAVFTLGYPVPDFLGSEPRLTSGEVNALSAGETRSELIQVSVPLQPGNSGGPLVNERGQVVGIITGSLDVTWFYEAYETLPQDINWAVHADYARPLFDEPGLLIDAASREEAIERVRRAVCQVVVRPE